MRVLNPDEQTGPSVVTIGKFDGVHIGHQALLRAAREEAALLGLPWGVVTFARHPAETLQPLEAPPYLTPLPVKRRLLAAAGADFLVLLEPDPRLLSLTPSEFVERFLVRDSGAKVVVTGDDFRFGRGRAGDVGELTLLGEVFGFRVRVVPPVTLEGRRVSSYAVRVALGEANLPLTHQMLGRPYSVEGEVVTGRQLGRKLGFPTANLQIPERVVLPANGIYAVTAEWEGTARPAVATLGVRPTVEQGPAPVLLEVHVLDWEGDLYGRRVTVVFRQRLRDEVRFASTDALREQIAQDVESARAVHTQT